MQVKKAVTSLISAQSSQLELGLIARILLIAIDIST